MLGFFAPFYDQLSAMLRKQQGQLAFDRIDRLNSWFTPLVLVATSIAVSCKQYFGNPLKCWTPREFSGSWDGYVHDFCFIENTYFVPNGTEITDEARGERHINYYRWVPLVLLIQAAMFVVPYCIWNFLHKKTEINLKGSLRHLESTYKNGIPATACEAFANELWGKLMVIRKHANRYAGVRATIHYFILKLGFIVNCILQMVLLKHFLSVDDYFWGFFHLYKVEFKGTAEHEDSIFPRIVLCDFKVRNLGQQHQHTVSCIMILNMIIEKFYVAFYFWLIFVFIVTTISMLHFGFQMIFRRHSLIPTNLNTKARMNPTRSWNFIRYYLNMDGVLLLTYIDGQFGAFLTSSVIDCLLEKYIHELQPDSSTMTSLHEENPERYVAFDASKQYTEFSADTIPLHKLKNRMMGQSLLEEVDGPSAPQEEPKKQM